MSMVPDQRINLDVWYPTYLVEKSEELKAINNDSRFQYYIQIVDADKDGFKGRFVVYPQVTKTQTSLTADDQAEDTVTLGVDHHNSEVLNLVEQHNVDPGATINATTTTNITSTGTITAPEHMGATNSLRPPNTINPTSSTHTATSDPVAACSRSNSGTVTSPIENAAVQERHSALVLTSASPHILPADDSHISNLAVEPSTVSSNSKQSDDSSYRISEVSENPCQSEEGQINASLQMDFLRELKQKRLHALYHTLHKGGKCPYHEDADLCRQNYDDDSAMMFKHYFSGWKFCDKGCEQSFIDHLASNVCDSSCPLWKFCLTHKIHGALKHAHEGFVIYSRQQESMVGKICPKYIDYQQKTVIGKGAFGKVYKLNENFAVKEEYKRPLIFLDSGVFQLVTEFNNTIDDHVIPLLEYVVGGPSSEDSKKRVFLFVMPLMNKGGLNEHFKENKSILEYMTNFLSQKECIFSNYMVVFLHVFKGLQYLHSRSIVHGDIKDTNILVHQTCSCVSPLQCSCPGDGGVTYVIGDMDLFCVQGKALSGKYLNWAKQKFTEPSGTRGLKATELYFMGMQGEKCASNKTDIWASSLTMMKILVGDNAIKSAIKYLGKFFDTISLHSSEHVFNIAEAQEIAKQLQKDISFIDLSKERPRDIEYLTKTAMSIRDKFKKMSKLLASGEFLKQGRWMFSYTYPEKLPLPLIIGAVHGANVLYEQCLDKVPSIFDTPLWKIMTEVQKIIQACVKFLPDDRPDALRVITDLEKLQNK